MNIPRVIQKALAGKVPSGDGYLHGSELRIMFLGAALALALITPGAGLAEESEANKSEFVPSTLYLGLPRLLDRDDRIFLAQNPTGTTDTLPQPSSTETPAKPRKPLRFEETETGKSYLL